MTHKHYRKTPDELPHLSADAHREIHATRQAGHELFRIARQEANTQNQRWRYTPQHNHLTGHPQYGDR